MTVRVRHLIGGAAWTTAAAGCGLAAGGAALLRAAALGPDGWVFLGLAGAALLAAGAVVAMLPWRLATDLGPEGVTLRWALGRRRVAWASVDRVLIGTLGSGGQRDPCAVTLLLRDGSELTYAVVSRGEPADDPAVARLLEAAAAASVRVDNVLAPPEERRRREEEWRKKRLKGWR